MRLVIPKPVVFGIAVFIGSFVGALLGRSLPLNREPYREPEPVAVYASPAAARAVKAPAPLPKENPYTNVKQTIIGHDSHQRWTLNGVAVGAPIDEALPACPSGGEDPTSLCHGPLRKLSVKDTFYVADVFGFAAGKTDDDKPAVMKMWLATKPNSTIIDTVYADLYPYAAFPMAFTMIDGFGKPSRIDTLFEHFSWDNPDGTNMYLSGTAITSTPVLALYQH